MPQEGKLSFIGLANWDEDLFENMCWPDPFDGDDPILDKQAFLYELLAETAEMEVIYPNPDVMKLMIQVWSQTRCPVWNLLWATTQYEYNPIENYNRIEDGTDTDVHTGTDTNTTTPLAEHYKAAYNSAASGTDDGLVKVTRDEGETVNETVYGTTDSTTGSATYGSTVTTGHGETVTNGFGTTDSESGSVTFGNTMTHEHDLNVHGNIGTVTTQQMIKEQREIVTFNFYDIMIRDFKERFCIMVY